MPVEVHTLFGTRVLLLADGGRITITKDESDLVKLSVQSAQQRLDDVPLTQSDCLALIEFLAVASRPGSGRPLLDALMEENPTGTTCSVCHEPQYNTYSGDTCKNGHGGAEPDPL